MDTIELIDEFPIKFSFNNFFSFVFKVKNLVKQRLKTFSYFLKFLIHINSTLIFYMHKGSKRKKVCFLHQFSKKADLG